MHRNPKAVRDLQEKVKTKEIELAELNQMLFNEKGLVPVGYAFIGWGDEVKEGAIAFEPYHKNWSKTHNSVGNKINEQGYVDGITHRGYKYANPI